MHWPATSFVVWLAAVLAVLHVLGVRLGPLLTGAGLPPATDPHG